jgi:hypothetical protein
MWSSHGILVEEQTVPQETASTFEVRRTLFERHEHDLIFNRSSSKTVSLTTRIFFSVAGLGVFRTSMRMRM